MICRGSCLQSSGPIVFGTGVSRVVLQSHSPSLPAYVCRTPLQERNPAASTAPQNHSGQFPASLALGQPCSAKAKAFCSLLPLSQLELTLQVNRTDGPGPESVCFPQVTALHGLPAAYLPQGRPQLQDVPYPCLITLRGTQDCPPGREGARHLGGGSTAPLAGRSQTTWRWPDGQQMCRAELELTAPARTPSPTVEEQHLPAGPSQEKGAQASKPPLCPCSPHTGYSAIRWQALGPQPRAWLGAARPLPGSALPAAWPPTLVPRHAGLVGQWPGGQDSTCMLRLHHRDVQQQCWDTEVWSLPLSLGTHFHPWARHADTQAAHAASCPRELAWVKTKPILS